MAPLLNWYTQLSLKKSYIKQQSIIKLKSSYAINLQCNNFSQFTLKGDNERAIARYDESECVNMLMNTFDDLDSYRILYFSPDVKGLTTYYIYAGLNNFYQNLYHECLVAFNLRENLKIKFENCVVSNQNTYNKGVIFKRVNGDQRGVIMAEKCYFNVDVASPDCTFTITNCVQNGNPTTIPLAHYIVDGLCPGVNASDPAGCQNNTCPDQNGCAPEKFEFGKNDYTYNTFFPGVNTPIPDPTSLFTPSVVFSYSNQFSYSDFFSSSFMFSSSSDSTISRYFTKSCLFSNSHSFTYSSSFSDSTHFSKSEKFSISSAFSKSDDFSKSLDFTKSTLFTKSSYFSSSNAFSETDDFSKSTFFSNSYQFTKSKYFSDSKHFSKSTMFTESIGFTKSSLFMETGEFSKSSLFSLSRKFTKTGYFTKSTDFTNSAVFSYSNKFSNSL